MIPTFTIPQIKDIILGLKEEIQRWEAMLVELDRFKPQEAKNEEQNPS
jgi:hypothetical protein